MGQNQSCRKHDAVQEVVNRAPDGGSNNLPRLENPQLGKEPIITQVLRRHKGARLPKQRELMVAGLQVRQQQGESISYLLNSLPYGSIIQVESNTHLLIAQPIRRLQMAIYQNHLGNVQIASVTSQEGIVPPLSIQKGHILVTVNGKSIKTVDQAVELLSVPEKLLLVLAEAPLDKKDRQKLQGTTRVVDSVLTKQDIRKSNSSLLDSPKEEEEKRQDRHRGGRRHSRRRKHERRGSGSSHGSHGSSKSYGSSSSARRRTSSSKHKTTTGTPLRNQDKVIPTISDPSGNLHNSGSSSMSSSQNLNEAEAVRNKIWVSKDNNNSKESSNILLISTMDTANTTVISYDDDGQGSSQNNDSFLVLSPSSSMTGPSSDGAAAAAAIVTPTPSLQDVSKIGSYDEDDNGRPLVFQTTSSDDQDEVSPAGVASAKTAAAAANDDYTSKLQGTLAKLDKFLDETMMELAFVMVEMENISNANDKKKSSGDASTAEQLEAVEKELRHKIFDILDARQQTLQKQQEESEAASKIQKDLSLPTIEEQEPKAGLETATPAASPKLKLNLKQPPSPPPKISLTQSSALSTKKVLDLEQQLLELQNANKVLKQELVHKDVQLNEFQEFEKQSQQNKITSTRIQW